MSFKKIKELETVISDAYNVYFGNDKQTKDLFNKIFVADKFYEKIKKRDTYFIIGEKGSGKTAYAAYFCNNEKNTISKLSMVDEDIFARFIAMRIGEELRKTSYKKIWKNIIYFMLFHELYCQLNSSFLSRIKYRKLLKHLKDYNSNFSNEAYNPDYNQAIDMVIQKKNEGGANLGAENKKKGLKGEASFKIETSTESRFTETNSSLPLDNLLLRSEGILNGVKVKKSINFFIDGIDIRPKSVTFEHYIECIEGLVNAVIDINRKNFKDLDLRIILLIRPDLLWNVDTHNMSGKITNNSVLLDWHTSDEDYGNSPIFLIADNYFNKQQKQEKKVGESWKHYFPFIKKKNKKLEPFVKILRITHYKPRDIISILNILIDLEKENLSGENNNSFREDFLKNIDFRNKYKDYFKEQLIEHLSVYMSKQDFNILNEFLIFLSTHQLKKVFNRTSFVELYEKFYEEQPSIPSVIDSADKILTLLYEAGVIGFFDFNNNWHWFSKEKSYSNQRPSIKEVSSFVFHEEYAFIYRIYRSESNMGKGKKDSPKSKKKRR
ncbi:hypothetical protein FOC73_08995 [Streptococcus salivarius]|uniref:P-loop ATPase, Sll1717 family n=1 Tax=Streptococcus salivarius TaxID=1304 RepID=UPI0015616786|nr:hypothetical protein [Streptococcus salivarius]QKH71262.1 hypothetical protein FOC73_08995 [Streptococcus salivarius]